MPASSTTSQKKKMCLSLHAKGEIDTEEALPPIRIRKRYSPARKEVVLELVRSRKPCKTGIEFWFCICGSRMHTDLLICHDCGRHRHHHHMLPGEIKKIEKAYESLSKQLVDIEKDLKNVRKDCCEKKDCDKDKSKDDKADCKCEEKRKQEESQKCKCKCDQPKKEEKPCNCSKPPPPPKPTPIIPQVPYIPMIPPYMAPAPPRPQPLPEIKPDCPGQEPPVVNVIVPECRDHRRRGSRHRRRRSPSVSSTSSSVSIHSFQRVKRSMSGLGRRIWNLEGREYFREEEERLRRAEEDRRRFYEAEERARRREESARERARREDDFEQDRWRDRRHWRFRDHAGWSPEQPIQILPCPFPIAEPRPHNPRGWPFVERWEGERRGLF